MISEVVLRGGLRGGFEGGFERWFEGWFEPPFNSGFVVFIKTALKWPLYHKRAGSLHLELHPPQFLII